MAGPQCRGCIWEVGGPAAEGSAGAHPPPRRDAPFLGEGGSPPENGGGGSPPEIEGLSEGGSPPETEGGVAPPPTLPREAPLPGEGKGRGSFHKVETLTAAGRGSTQIRLHGKRTRQGGTSEEQEGEHSIWG